MSITTILTQIDLLIKELTQKICEAHYQKVIQDFQKNKLRTWKNLGSGSFNTVYGNQGPFVVREAKESIASGSGSAETSSTMTIASPTATKALYSVGNLELLSKADSDWDAFLKKAPQIVANLTPIKKLEAYLTWCGQLLQTVYCFRIETGLHGDIKPTNLLVRRLIPQQAMPASTSTTAEATQEDADKIPVFQIFLGDIDRTAHPRDIQLKPWASDIAATQVFVPTVAYRYLLHREEHHAINVGRIVDAYATALVLWEALSCWYPFLHFTFTAFHNKKNKIMTPLYHTLRDLKKRKAPCSLYVIKTLLGGSPNDKKSHIAAFPKCHTAIFFVQDIDRIGFISKLDGRFVLWPQEAFTSDEFKQLKKALKVPARITRDYIRLAKTLSAEQRKILTAAELLQAIPETTNLQPVIDDIQTKLDNLLEKEHVATAASQNAIESESTLSDLEKETLTNLFSIISQLILETNNPANTEEDFLAKALDQYKIFFPTIELPDVADRTPIPINSTLFTNLQALHNQLARFPEDITTSTPEEKLALFTTMKNLAPYLDATFIQQDSEHSLTSSDTASISEILTSLFTELEATLNHLRETWYHHLQECALTLFFIPDAKKNSKRGPAYVLTENALYYYTYPDSEGHVEHVRLMNRTDDAYGELALTLQGQGITLPTENPDRSQRISELNFSQCAMLDPLNHHALFNSVAIERVPILQNFLAMIAALFPSSKVQFSLDKTTKNTVIRFDTTSTILQTYTFHFDPIKETLCCAASDHRQQLTMANTQEDHEAVTQFCHNLYAEHYCQEETLSTTEPIAQNIPYLRNFLNDMSIHYPEIKKNFNFEDRSAPTIHFSCAEHRILKNYYIQIYLRENRAALFEIATKKCLTENCRVEEFDEIIRHFDAANQVKKFYAHPHVIAETNPLSALWEGLKKSYAPSPSHFRVKEKTIIKITFFNNPRLADYSIELNFLTKKAQLFYHDTLQNADLSSFEILEETLSLNKTRTTTICAQLQRRVFSREPLRDFMDALEVQYDPYKVTVSAAKDNETSLILTFEETAPPFLAQYCFTLYPIDNSIRFQYVNQEYRIRSLDEYNAFMQVHRDQAICWKDDWRHQTRYYPKLPKLEQYLRTLHTKFPDLVSQLNHVKDAIVEIRFCDSAPQIFLALILTCDTVTQKMWLSTTATPDTSLELTTQDSLMSAITSFWMTAYHDIEIYPQNPLLQSTPAMIDILTNIRKRFPSIECTIEPQNQSCCTINFAGTPQIFLEYSMTFNIVTGKMILFHTADGIKYLIHRWADLLKKIYQHHYNYIPHSLFQPASEPDDPAFCTVEVVKDLLPKERRKVGGYLLIKKDSHWECYYTHQIRNHKLSMQIPMWEILEPSSSLLESPHLSPEEIATLQTAVAEFHEQEKKNAGLATDATEVNLFEHYATKFPDMAPKQCILL